VFSAHWRPGVLRIQPGLFSAWASMVDDIGHDAYRHQNAAVSRGIIFG